ncbi:MAG: hypothetical protein ACKVOI_10540 [Dongiaceae bacterium]
MAVLATAPGAAAQTLLGQSEPVNLLPLTEPETQTGEDTSSGTASGAPQGFEMETLEEVGGDFAGPLTPQNGGLQPSLWRGSSRSKVERLLARLPLHHSPALASLTRTVLLTNAGPPPGQGTGVNILALRARILAEMGFLQDALQLLRMAPARAMDSTASRVLVALSWQALDVDGACAALLLPAVPFEINRELQQQRVFCQWRTGREGDAQLGMDLLREEGAADPFFAAVMDRLGGSSEVKVPPPPEITPARIAMYHESQEPLPGNAFDLASIQAVTSLAMDTRIDPELRLSAAEAAASQGALAAQVVRDVYAAQTIKPEDLQGAAALPETGASARDRAVLYQAAAAAPVPSVRASILQVALGPTGWADNDNWRLQVFAPFLMDLPPAPELSWYAPEAAHYLFALGEFEQARAWIELTQGDQSFGEGSVDTNSAIMLPSLLALDYLAGGYESVPVMGSFLAQGQVNASPDSVERLQAIFSAFDDSLPDSADGAFVDSGDGNAPKLPKENLNLWLDLGDVSAKGMQGETGLLALVGLRDLATVDPLWLQRALAGLRRVGLEKDARRIAVEAAIANGL